MTDELENLMVRVRGDTRGFARDVAAMRQTLGGELEQGAVVAGRGIEAALGRATRGGRLGFEDLGRAAVKALADVAAEALKLELAPTGGAGGGSAAGIGGLLTSLLGAPGRATGGLVAPDRPYRVGERGPEWFVPSSSGTVLPNAGAARGATHVTVNVAAPRDAQPAFMARTGTQVARAVRQALERAGR